MKRKVEQVLIRDVYSTIPSDNGAFYYQLFGNMLNSRIQR